VVSENGCCLNLVPAWIEIEPDTTVRALNLPLGNKPELHSGILLHHFLYLLTVTVFPSEGGRTTDTLPAFGARSGGNKPDRTLERVVTVSGSCEHEKEQQERQSDQCPQGKLTNGQHV